MKQILLIPIVMFIFFSTNVNAEVMVETAIIDPVSGADELVDIGTNADDFLPESDRNVDIAVAPPAQQFGGVARDSDPEFSRNKLINTDIEPVESRVIAVNVNLANPDYPAGELKSENANIAGNLKEDYSFGLSGGDITLKADVLRKSSTVLEPSSIILFVLGLLGLGLIRRQKGDE